MAAEGLPNAEITRRTGTSRPMVVDWRGRYESGGIRALENLPHRRSMRSTSWFATLARDSRRQRIWGDVNLLPVHDTSWLTTWAGTPSPPHPASDRTKDKPSSGPDFAAPP